MLITDPSSVSAPIQRSRGTGMVQASRGELVMKYIPQDNPVPSATSY